MAVLEKGKRNVEILKQPQYSPVSVEKQVAMIFLGTNNLMSNVPLKKVKEFEKEFLNQLENRFGDVLKSLGGKKVDDTAQQTLKELAAEISLNYKG